MDGMFKRLVYYGFISANPIFSVDWYNVKFTDSILCSDGHSEGQVTVLNGNPTAVHYLLIRTCLLAPG